jgi:hypothetical protein
MNVATAAAPASAVSAVAPGFAQFGVRFPIASITALSRCGSFQPYSGAATDAVRIEEAKRKIEEEKRKQKEIDLELAKLHYKARVEEENRKKQKEHAATGKCSLMENLGFDRLTIGCGLQRTLWSCAIGNRRIKWRCCCPPLSLSSWQQFWSSTGLWVCRQTLRPSTACFIPFWTHQQRMAR